MNNITNAEKKVDIYNKSMRLWLFLQKMEVERNPKGLRTDLRKTIYSNLNRLSGNWTFEKENSLGYKLYSSSNSQINNKLIPNFVELSFISPVMDKKHLKEIMESARVDAINDGVSLQINRKTLHAMKESRNMMDNDNLRFYSTGDMFDVLEEEIEKYTSVIGLINNPIALPVSQDEFNELYNINNENIKIADEKKGKVIIDPKNKKRLIIDPEASFYIHDFMQQKELRTETTKKDVIKFNIGKNVNNLGNISYSIDNNHSEYFDLVISGNREQINNLISIPRFDEEKSFGFNPKKSSIEFTGIPKNILPTEMADILDGIPGNKKTVRVLLDEKSRTYVEDCKYINNVYRELMIINPEKYSLEIYDNYGINSKKEVFTDTHGPGAAYNEEISNRPQFKNNNKEEKYEL